MSRSLSLLPLVLCLSAASNILAQEHKELGRMWLFENPPLAYLEKEYGFKPTQSWFDSLRLASIRFGGKDEGWCSSSFVSPKGLIMTNHHCVRDAVDQTAKDRGENWITEGYYARSLEDEVRLMVPNRMGGGPVAVQQLIHIEDVTAKVNEGVADGDDDSSISKKREANKKKILEAVKKEGTKPQVVELHQGARYHLYVYKIWDDIRLVCAPHLQTAHFGGDPDNFTYPRYSIDFAFCRAYEDGKPADTSKHYFKWSLKGAQPDQLVFVTGNPGSTGRLLTKAQMDHLRDAEYPITLATLDDDVQAFSGFLANNPQLRPQIEAFLLGQQNSQKAVRGYLSGLIDEKLMAEKVAMEKKFQDAVMADPKLAAKYGKAWGRIAEINEELTKLVPTVMLCNPRYSLVLARASAIVAATDPKAEEGARDQVAKEAKGMRIPAGRLRHPLYSKLNETHLARAKRFLPADHPFRKILIGDLEPAAALKQLVASQVTDDTFVSELLEGGKEAVDKSTDLAIRAARECVPLIEKAQARIKELQEQESVQASLIGQALFAVYGDKISPDATMTLRFADGRVKGYSYNGTLAPWRTTFYGLYGRSAEFGGEDPFHLPPLWVERKDKIDMTKAVNFVSTNDIIGGNSGSPVVNKDLEVVGLIFDGNIEQLPNRFLFKENNERSVSVHTDAIMEALLKIYDAGRIANELTGKVTEASTDK